MSTFFTLAAVYGPLCTLAALGLTVLSLARPARRAAGWDPPLVFCIAATIAGAATGSALWAAALALAALGSSLALARRLPLCHPAGIALCVSACQLIVFWLLWAPDFVACLRTSATTRVLIAAAVLLITLGIPGGMLTTFLSSEVLARRSWSRTPPPVAQVTHCGPMVSIHVPCHNEPPDLVIGTLDALAALDYERFEVLVIDNNTRDPALWRPVQAHCAALGGRFRFLHVENMAGAKAGALNLALRHTAEDASLVAVVDADNQVETTFLSHLAAHFEDERLGFVQTWYDFREWSHSAFMTGCFWEYRAAFPATMRSLNERTAAFPMGTVVLFRRTAIAEAGGWAEWCMTEDSELGTRITALGYTSLLINRTYGRGLIPETLAAYKKQRYRWTFGPAQAIRRHWRLYLPPRYARPSRLTGAQRLFGMGAAISLVGRVGNLLTLPVAVAALGSALLHHDSLPGNPLLWLALPLSITATSVTRITTATLVMRCTLRESLLMLLCTSALAYTVQTASLAGLITSRSDWRHTRKFQARCTGWRAILTTRAETLLGSVVAATAITAMARDTSGLLLPIETAVLIRGLAYLTSPLAAVLAQRGIARRSLPTAQVPHPKSATELTAQR